MFSKVIPGCLFVKVILWSCTFTSNGGSLGKRETLLLEHKPLLDSCRAFLTRKLNEIGSSTV